MTACVQVGAVTDRPASLRRAGSAIIRKVTSVALGFPPVASPRALVGDPRIARLKDALTAMDRHDEGRKVLALLRLDGFVATQPALFDSIAAKVDAVRRLG